MKLKPQWILGLSFSLQPNAPQFRDKTSQNYLMRPLPDLFSIVEGWFWEESCVHIQHPSNFNSP